jgi:hypothetical protein
MGNTSSDSKPKPETNYVTSESAINIKFENLVDSPNMIDTMSAVSPTVPNMATAYSATSAEVQTVQAGGYEETEINIEIQEMQGGYESDGGESSIEINTMTFENTMEQKGGSTDPSFDSNKLLNIIMQLGGDNGDSSSVDKSDSDNFTETVSTANSSSINKKSHKKKLFNDDGDSPSDSDSSSDSDSDSSSDSESDASPINSDGPVSSFKLNTKNNLVSSDVYIMSDSDSVGGADITKLNFNPIKNKSKRN